MKEGESIGPYTCTADCNPPCDISWKHKDVTNGKFFDVASTALLDSHILNRSIVLFRCLAKYSLDNDFKIIKNIDLDVLCKYINSYCLNATHSNAVFEAYHKNEIQLNEKVILIYIS